jgi:N-acetylglutamate synthase-like GNAT family acetyltransferase
LSPELSTDLTFRAATMEDAPAIKSLIRSARINPMDLDWRRFLIVTSPEETLLACGQVKPHSDGTLELASIAVHPEWRGRGLARAVIARLLVDSPRPLYLTCRSGLGALYAKFGFRALRAEELTPYFRRIQKLANAMMGVFRDGETLLVMRLD